MATAGKKATKTAKKKDTSTTFGARLLLPEWSSCSCNNLCNRREKRGACPCLIKGSFCSRLCNCGTNKMMCTNRSGHLGSILASELGIARSVDTDSSVESDVGENEMLLVSFVEEDGRDEHINIASSSVHDRSIQFVVEKVTGPSGQSVTEDDGTLPSTSTRDKDSQDTSTMKDLQHQVRCLDHHQLAEFALSAIHDHPELERLLPSGNYPQTPEDTVPGWCHCGNCREMTLPEEQLCCRRRTGRCILLLAADVFQTSILNRVTLQIAVTNKNDLFVHADAASNDNLRHAAYRQYVLYKHGSLGKGNRVVIPSCVVWSIRNAYPSHNEIYTGFKPSRFN